LAIPGSASDQPAFLRFFDWPDSDMAMATACLRLFTFFPEPLLSAIRNALSRGLGFAHYAWYAAGSD
jgi:hypothetical protein